MASVFPDGNYYTKSVSLGNSTKTTIYTVGDQGEEAADLTGLSAVASAGVADTCTFHRLQASDATEYILVYRGPVETDYPLQIEGLPIHMTKGDAIKATATSGASPVHIHISINKITRSTGVK